MGCCDGVLSLKFTLGAMAQVGACPNYVENTSMMTKGDILLGHHLRRPVWAYEPRLRPAQFAYRLHFGSSTYAQKYKKIRIPILVLCQKSSESMEIIKISGRPKFVTVLRRRLLGRWAL
jgi:hypothetical protein